MYPESNSLIKNVPCDGDCDIGVSVEEFEALFEAPKAASAGSKTAFGAFVLLALHLTLDPKQNVSGEETI